METLVCLFSQALNDCSENPRIYGFTALSCCSSFISWYYPRTQESFNFYAHSFIGYIMGRDNGYSSQPVFLTFSQNGDPRNLKLCKKPLLTLQHNFRLTHTIQSSARHQRVLFLHFLVSIWNKISRHHTKSVLFSFFTDIVQISRKFTIR